MSIIETLNNQIVNVFTLVGDSEHVYRGTILMQDESGLLIRCNRRNTNIQTKIVFFPADKLLRIEQDD